VSTPDEAVQASLAEQAAAVTGAASPDVSALDLSNAQAAVVDASEILDRLRALEQSAQAAHAAANPAPPPVDNTLKAESNAPGWMHDLVAKIEARLSALEN
jgi:hypothetical protein